MNKILFAAVLTLSVVPSARAGAALDELFQSAPNSARSLPVVEAPAGASSCAERTWNDLAQSTLKDGECTLASPYDEMVTQPLCSAKGSSGADAVGASTFAAYVWGTEREGSVGAESITLHAETKTRRIGHGAVSKQAFWTTDSYDLNLRPSGELIDAFATVQRVCRDEADCAGSYRVDRYLVSSGGVDKTVLVGSTRTALTGGALARIDAEARRSWAVALVQTGLRRYQECYAQCSEISADARGCAESCP